MFPIVVEGRPPAPRLDSIPSREFDSVLGDLLAELDLDVQREKGAFIATVGGRLVALLAQHVLPRRLRALAVGQVTGVLVHPAAIAPQPLGDMLRGVVKRAVGIRRLARAAPAQADEIAVAVEEAVAVAVAEEAVAEQAAVTR